VRVDLLPEARDDLVAGFRFYERQARGLGGYFLRSLFGDIDLLSTHGGVHAKIFGYHRSLSNRFPFSIYYRGEMDVVGVRAVLDCRRKPSWIKRKLGGA